MSKKSTIALILFYRHKFITVNTDSRQLKSLCILGKVKSKAIPVTGREGP
jgi:hypothetical protein